MLVKTFEITLRDGREKSIKAESYRREDDKYVFDGTPSGEVEFFMADEVVGITVPDSTPLLAIALPVGRGMGGTTL